MQDLGKLTHKDEIVCPETQGIFCDPNKHLVTIGPHIINSQFAKETIQANIDIVNDFYKGVFRVGELRATDTEKGAYVFELIEAFPGFKIVSDGN